MKAGILTFHMAFNFGAMLQAYALSKKLNGIGIEAEIIDYRLPFIDRYHHKYFLPELINKNGIIIGTLKFAKKTMCGYYSNKQWNRFYSFMTKDLPHSEQLTKEALPDTDYDMYICGSDQIWNGELTGGLQSTYFCDFVKGDKIKLAYAASSGTSYIKGDNVDIKKLLGNFSAIGARENRLCDFINNELHINAKQVIDPTLLLSADEWSDIVKKPKYDKYLLIYAFQENNLIYDLARMIAKKKGLKIIAVSYRNKDIGDDIIQITDAGPKEFVSLFKYADFVCTTSFHGTAFSVIFNKQFYCVPHELYHERTDNLLDLLGLSDRNIYSLNECVDMDIDYTKVSDKLSRERESSIKFISEWREKA